jgi:hypothetical protein
VEWKPIGKTCGNVSGGGGQIMVEMCDTLIKIERVQVAINILRWKGLGVHRRRGLILERDWCLPLTFYDS